MKNYETQIKETVVTEFVYKNKRTPTSLELKELIAEYKSSHPNLAIVGKSGYDIVKPGFMSSSSSTEENKNIRALKSDFELADNRIDYLAEQLAVSDIGLASTVRKLQRELTGLESRLDNILLFTQIDNPFLIGYEETFTTGNKLDMSRSSVSLESFGLTASKRNLGAFDLSNTKITYSTSANKGFLSFFNNSGTDSLKEDDGQVWTHQVYTRYSSGRVAVELTLDFNNEIYVGNVRLNFVSFARESNMKITTSYSVDGITFMSVTPGEVNVVDHEFFMDVGVDKIKKLRFIISKEYADANTLQNQYVYHFSLDSLKIYSNVYSSEDSIAFLGPYPMYDDNLDDYFFTKATCELCLSSGDESSVNVFLSKDNLSYFPLRDSNDYVLFGNSVTDDSGQQIVDTAAKYAIVDDDECEYDSSTEGVLNFYIPQEYLNRFIPKSLIIKRNIPVTGSLDNIDGVEPGWILEDGLYKTTIFVDNPNGTTLDFGPTLAYINNVEVTGKVSVPYGYSTFATSVNNWRAVDSGAASLGDLKNSDKLYPYNHKLLIEGYSYVRSFNEEKIYNGFEYFSKLMRYVPVDYFNAHELDLDIYTYEETNSGLKFKVKVNKSLNNWSEEKFQGSWSLQDESGNELWVKLLLRSKTNTKSAIVNSFKLRVI